VSEKNEVVNMGTTEELKNLINVKTGLEWSDGRRKESGRSWEGALYTWAALFFTSQQGIQEGNFSTPDAKNAKRLFYESTSPQARTGVEDTNSD